MKLESMGFRYDGDRIQILDQTRLPQEQVWLDGTDPDEMIRMIKTLQVRGAPMIGLAAVMVLAHQSQKGGLSEKTFRGIAERLRQARPTAVNLMNNIDRLLSFAPGQYNPDWILNEAVAIFKEDRELCQQIADNGTDMLISEFLEQRQAGDNRPLGILTHCNTGGLATAGVGTAIGIFRELHKRTQALHVYVDETRPLLQGGRLTAWEMKELDIPYTLLCDNMAAILMRDKEIDCVIVGCDRIARNGDIANKVGTYGLAALARFHGIPFFVAAPQTTLDLNCPTGDAIPIEERAADEVRGAKGAFGSAQWAPADAPVYNPAFDVTPAELISAWILDRGVFASPAEMIETIMQN
jgi:methylthioribose-1-phosphate isomerase